MTHWTTKGSIKPVSVCSCDTMLRDTQPGGTPAGSARLQSLANLEASYVVAYFGGATPAGRLQPSTPRPASVDALVVFRSGSIPFAFLNSSFLPPPHSSARPT